MSYDTNIRRYLILCTMLIVNSLSPDEIQTLEEMHKVSLVSFLTKMIIVSIVCNYIHYKTTC